MKNKWMHFGLDRESIFGLACAVIMVLLSTAMALFQNEIGNIILRDVFMILILGFLTPLYYILVTKKKKLSVLGIHKNKLSASLVINAAAGISLLAVFVGGNTQRIVFGLDSFYAITYILAAGIFEMVFIYGFLRYEFERAFGILPAILITAIFSVSIMRAFNRNLRSCSLWDSCMLRCSILHTIFSRSFRFSGALALSGMSW